MSPALKYTLGRLGLFVAVFAALLPVPLNLLVKAMIALIASAGFSYFLLAKWRIEMGEQLGARRPAPARREGEAARRAGRRRVRGGRRRPGRPRPAATRSRDIPSV